MVDLSDFERSAIAALAAGDPESAALMAQLAAASCVSRDYTDIGLYTELTVTKGLPRLDPTRSMIEGSPPVYAEHPDVPAGAGLILWLEDGYISCLESYTYEGCWPENESLFRLTT